MLDHPINEPRAVLDRARELGTVMLGVLADSVFLALWFGAQWALDHHLLRRFPPNEVDKPVLLAAQFTFAASTLVPVVIYLVADLWVLVLRARRRVTAEREALGLTQ